MTVPNWWQAVLLVLASYRLTRLGGWDAFPPVARARAWLIGETWVPLEEREWNPPCWEPKPTSSPEPEMPGKQPSSSVEGVRPAYRRPTLAHLVHCPFCLGWWVTLACWSSFEAWPRGALIALSPFALAGAVGLVGKDLD